jgi:hypothetical protein
VRVITIPVEGATIVIDARHGGASDGSPQHNIATGANYDELRASIIAGGNTLVPRTAFTSADLAGSDALILRETRAISDNYTVEEIAAIHSYVAAGHGLLVAAEGGGFFTPDVIGVLNELVAPYGIVYGDTRGHSSGGVVTGFVPHPITAGIDTVGVLVDHPMSSITSPAVDLTVGGGEDNILAAVMVLTVRAASFAFLT